LIEYAKIMEQFPVGTLAYVIGIAIGDGNLSNPNDRAIRLRITCDAKYPLLIQKISKSVKEILPQNKVSIIYRSNTYIDISCYSNQWIKWLPWKTREGPKSKQRIIIPEWIKNNNEYTRKCLCGLIETDGSIYKDRKYMMVNFTTVIESLAKDVLSSIENLGFYPKMYCIKTPYRPKYVIRLARNTEKFIKILEINKS
jgi:DNA-binding transcriptional regulator WhiA